jgi:cytoskeleton protein RodZ
MMSHSNDESNDESNTDSIDKNIDFGSLLAEGRKANNYTVDEISGYLKIPVSTIIALEASDIEALPAPTFAQGYIRTYAKFLEMSEDKVLDIYNRVVPHGEESDLKPRSNLPGEASSQSPLVKTITILLIIAGIAVMIFGSFQYYQKKANVMESELDAKQQSFTGNSLDSPSSNRLNIKQNARLTEDDELVVEESGEQESFEADRSDAGELAQQGESVEIEPEAVQSITDSGNGSDIIEIFAEQGSWMEVRDANKSRLLYNMLPAGSSRVLEGQAPFSISMGNARTTRVLINDLEIDLTGYIRSNNTANFKVSTQDQEIIFH